MENTFDLAKVLPILTPIILLQIVLLVAAIIDLIRQPKVRGPKWVWALVIIFVNIFGPIIYFLFGRKEE
jgi:hypothetical protein